jgi:hypothetical protein
MIRGQILKEKMICFLINCIELKINHLIHYIIEKAQFQKALEICHSRYGQISQE